MVRVCVPVGIWSTVNTKVTKESQAVPEGTLIVCTFNLQDPAAPVQSNFLTALLDNAAAFGTDRAIEPDALRENGLLEDGLFIVTADHGHKATGGHGRFSKIESYSTIAVAGKTVVSGGTMDKDVKLRDVAAISLYALGVEPNGWSFSARVPGNLFTDVKGQIRPYHGDLIDLLCGGFMWIYTNLGHPLDKFF